MTDTTPTAGSVLDRRQALFAAGALGVAGALAACGGDDPDTTGPDGADDNPGDDPDPTGDDAGSANPGDDPGEDSGDDAAEESGEDQGEDSGDEGSQPEGDVLAATDEVPVGGGVIKGDAQVVLTQPVEGEFKAFSSTCTHEACQVSDVSDGLIRCFCHGSRFFIADGGVENGPAASDLPEVGITVHDGEIYRG